MRHLADLDEAVLRRFEVRCLIDIADAKANEEILRRTLSGDSLEEDAERDPVDLGKVARICYERNYSASDVVSLCRQAAWVRVREHISGGVPSLSSKSAQRKKSRVVAGKGSDQGSAAGAARLAALMALARGSSGASAVGTSTDQCHQGQQQPLRPLCGRDFESTLEAATRNGSASAQSRACILEWHHRFGTAGTAGGKHSASFDVANQGAIAQMYS